VDLAGWFGGQIDTLALVALSISREERPDVLVVNRFVVPDDETGADFAERATIALQALAVRPGYVRGELGRAYDDPTHWSLVTEWESVGAYRRALGGFDVKVHATPLLAQSVDEPSAYEILITAASDGEVTQTGSDRAPEAERTIRSHP
jgi:antibiotic biosynthesis monooxygenase